MRGDGIKHIRRLRHDDSALCSNYNTSRGMSKLKRILIFHITVLDDWSTMIILLSDKTLTDMKDAKPGHLPKQQQFDKCSAYLKLYFTYHASRY